MVFPELVNIGYISKPNGFKGGLNVELDDELLEEGDFPEFIWIYREGKPVPFAVNSLEASGNKWLLFLEDITSEEAAAAFQNKTVLCEKEIHGDFFSAGDQSDAIIGYQVLDKKAGLIGQLSYILPNAVQPTLVIDKDGKEILVPYIEDIVVEINEETETIHIEAPEGLIEMYLNE